MSATDHHVEGSGHVLKAPIWITVIRGFQFILSLIIVGLAGRLMHDAYLDEHGLAIATSIITWVVIAYIVVTEKIPSLHKAYHVVAVLALDGFLVIMWLATFAAAAAKRAAFVLDVDVDSCYSDGSLVNSKTCFTKRGVILFESGLAMMAAYAGIGALVWLLFIATFAWTMIKFFRGRKEGRFMFSTGSHDHQMESQPMHTTAATGGEKIVANPHQQHQQPMQPQTTGPYQAPVAGTYPQQGQYAQEQYPQGQYPQGQYPPAGYQPPVSPSPVSAHQHQAPYSQAQELHGQQHPQQQELQGQQQYGQYPPQQQQQQQGYPSQQYGHPQQTTSPHSSELEGPAHQQYEMPSPPTASPPPQQYQQH